MKEGNNILWSKDNKTLGFYNFYSIMLTKDLRRGKQFTFMKQ